MIHATPRLATDTRRVPPPLVRQPLGPLTNCRAPPPSPVRFVDLENMHESVELAQLRDEVAQLRQENERLRADYEAIHWLLHVRCPLLAPSAYASRTTLIAP